MVHTAEDELKLKFCMCEAWLSNMNLHYCDCYIKEPILQKFAVASFQNLTVYRQSGSQGCQPEIFELQTEV